MHTLVFRFCNLLVAEAYRALLHLQNRDLQLPGPCSCFASSPGSNVSGGHFSSASFVGDVTTLLVLCGSFALSLIHI